MTDILIFIINNNFHYCYSQKKWYSVDFKYNKVIDKIYITNYYTTKELINIFKQNN
jgi:hypothetical protein